MYEFAIEFIILSGENEPNIPSGSCITKPPDCTVLDSWVFENFTSTDEPFAKPLRILKACVSINYNSYGKLVSSLESPIFFGERFKVTSVPFSFLILIY